MEEPIDVSSDSGTSTSIYFKLEISNIIASEIPEQKKTSYRRKITREVCIRCNLDNIKRSLEWKNHNAKISWLDVLSHNARKDSMIFFEVYAKHSHGENQRILQSEPIAMESMIAQRSDQGVCTVVLNLKDDSSDAYTTLTSATVSFTLAATPAVEQGQKTVKEAFVSKIDSRERWSNLVAPLQQVIKVCAGIAEVETHANIALACAKVACDIFVKPFELDDKVLKLMDEVEATLRLVVEVDTESGAHVLTKNQRIMLPALMHQINECILFVHEYSRQSYLATVAKALVKNYDSIIADYIGGLRNAKKQFRDSELRDIQVVVHRLEGHVRDIEHNVSILKLGQLRITEGAGRDPAKMCLNGTRVSILYQIRTWIHGGGPGADARILLIIGQAGVGKSAIAHSIANEYVALKRLGATFCFSKDRGPANFFRTLARSFADMDPLYASELVSSINSEKETSTSLDVQMTDVLLPPFKRLSVLGPIVVVIDALDECMDRNPLVDCLVKNISSIPTNIRILVTSRPTEAAKLRHQPWVTAIDLEGEPARQEDILLYVKERLKSEMSEPSSHGLKEADLNDIALHSEGLFQYASVVCSEILSSYSYEWRSGEPETPRQTFRRLVKDRKGGLDTLYSGLLEKLYPNTVVDSQGLQDFRRVMGWILTAQQRLTHDALVDFGHHMCNSDPNDRGGYNRVTMMLRPLGALLSGTQEGSTAVYPLHSSIRNYLTDKSRSGQFYIGPEIEQHLSLASVCLRLLVAPGRLCFNIASLESSYVSNKDVPDFKARVSTTVSTCLSYACTYWATHLRLSRKAPAEFDELDNISTLMNQKFLFWLEVLALQGKTGFTEDACQMLIVWFTTTHTVSTLSLERINLCLKFVRDYGEIIEDTTPHLYLSAVPQTPAILDTTLHQFAALPKVVRTSEDTTNAGDHPITYMALHGHTDFINSVEFSHDGQQAVTASHDGSVRIWDTQTYSQIGDALTGHTDEIQSASFSPDGTLVVSTSMDGTVRVWNAQSKAHEQVGESFTRHTESPRRADPEKASFLPNGKHVVSASYNIILFWDAVTHTEIAQPWYNRGVVFAVSPDGSCIALPTARYSTELEIRVIQTGTQIGQLLSGDWHSVKAVAFSPDGQHIVTSTDDKTLRTWDAKTGALINVMDGTGHITHISFYLDERHVMTSGWPRHGVRFWDMNTQSEIQQGISREIGMSCSVISPNGDRIASLPSGDDSVRIWSFDPLADDLTRTTTHDLFLLSASYSPDGKYIATACTDNSVRIWDAETCSQVGNPLVGHSDRGNSASFSPDGTLIVTASDDTTVRVWNVQTGAQVGEPLTGHARVVSALFSSDGTCILSADLSSIRVWSAGESDLGKLIHAIEVPSELWIRSVSFPPCGQLIAVNTDDNTQVLDLDTGTGAAVVPLEYRDRYACFSPDEHLMLFFGGQDNDLHLWNAKSGQMEKVFSGHTDTVKGASFSSDGKHIVSASLDHTIRVWSTETGSLTAVYQNLGRIHDPEDLKTIAVSPDGRRILSVYCGHDIRSWAMPDSLPPGTDLSHSADDPNPWRRAEIGDGTASLAGHTKDNSGQQEEILFCSASGRHSLMWLPCHVGVLNPKGPPVRILWEDSVHGTEWTKCYLGERDS